jgi:hypothetical protein
VFNIFSFDITNCCVSSNKTVRYCLSDGSEWMFLVPVYTWDDQGNRISYEGPMLTMMQSHEVFKKDVRCLVEVLYHWVCLALNAES